ncbi:MAG: hypothetical protein ACRDRL_02110 [Sciscionella sp.]
MDDDSLELVRASAEGAARALFGPAVDAVRAFTTTIFGDTGEAIDGYVAGRINDRRLLRQIEALGRAQQLCEEWGIDPHEVGLKTSIPLLEGVANEDDAGLREKWATLLANAAAGDGHDLPVYPSFVRILGELDATGAALVEWLYDPVTDPDAPRADSQGRIIVEDLEPGRLRLGVTGVDFDVIAENVIRLGLADRPLITGAYPYGGSPADVFGATDKIARTALGHAFLRACQPPRLG